jgi:hypothetical protein
MGGGRVEVEWWRWGRKQRERVEYISECETGGIELILPIDKCEWHGSIVMIELVSMHGRELLPAVAPDSGPESTASDRV